MRTHRHQKLALLACLLSLMLSCLSFPSFAEGPGVPAPVHVTWSDLVLDASGLISWEMHLPENQFDLQVKNYEVSMDIMTTGSWRKGFRTLKSQENSREISFSMVGIYRFQVRANFVGGLVSDWSDINDSPLCTVTSDYVTRDTGKGDETGGPGVNPGALVPVGPGVTPGSQNMPSLLPGWVEKTGTWQQDSFGNWMYLLNGSYCKNRWVCIYNPYANLPAGQKPYDWFCFDENGFLRTGWYTDPSGNIFYLNPVSDGTKGRMFTGWALIDGYWYYFNETEGTGSRGMLYRNTMTPDGHQVNAQGIRVS